MMAIVEKEKVADVDDTVEPQPYTRVVRDILPHRIDQMLVHSKRNTKTHVTASALTERSPTGFIFFIDLPPQIKNPSNV
jgi:hypothetical protein